MKAPLLLAAALTATPAFAQLTIPPASDPGALQQQRVDEAERRRLLEQLERPMVTDPLRAPPAPAPATRPADGGPSFMVREIRFTPSEILPVETLEALAGEYLGRRVSVADLLELVDRINAAYRSLRVVTAQAVLPPQEVSDGIVAIRLVEGRLGTLSIAGNDNTRQHYIRSRIGLQSGELVDLPLLERDLLRFNRFNDVQLRAELKPGSVFATSDLEILAEEPPRHDLRLSLDNGGSESTGEWRTGLVYMNRSLLGFRDELSLSATRALGQRSYSIAYGIPINASGGRVSVAHYEDRISVKRGPLATLDLTGKSSGTVLSVRQPVHASDTMRVDLTAGAKRRSTTNWISGVFLQRTRTRDANLGFDLQLGDSRGIWLASYGLVSGRADGLDRDRYRLGRGAIRRFQGLSEGWSLRAGLSFQHALDDLLPSSEQMLIGGENSVRGYPVGTHAGDSGLALNLELHHPMRDFQLSDSGLAVSTSGFFFVDHGRVKPFRPPGSTLPSLERITGIGWGLNAAIGQHVTVRVTLARALDRVQNVSHRNEVHFQLVASLF